MTKQPRIQRSTRGVLNRTSNCIVSSKPVVVQSSLISSHWGGTREKHGKASKVVNHKFTKIPKTKREAKAEDPDSAYESILAGIRPERKLRVRRIKKATLLQYDGCVKTFTRWAAESKRSLATSDKVDVAMSIYFHELFETDSSFNLASYTLFGWIALKMVPKQAERLLLPLARSALASWKSERPGETRVGVPPQVVMAFACYCVKHGCFQSAVAALMQYDLYARPSEILCIVGSDIVAPVRGMSNAWGIVFGNSERAILTKAKQHDDVVLANSVHRPWCGKLIQHVAKHLIHEPKPVFDLTLSQYEELFRSFSKDMGLPVSAFTPHTLRHSGPSFDILHHHRTLKEIQERGRWESINSVRRYKKPGRLLLNASRLPLCLQSFQTQHFSSALASILSQRWV